MPDIRTIRTVECATCGTTGPEDSYPCYITYRSSLLGHYCDGCVNWCDECDTYYTDFYCPNIDDHSDGEEEHDSYYCDCGCCSPESDYVHDYGYKPPPIFHGDGPMYLGAEIEVTTPWNSLDTCAETAVDYLGSLGYLKEDSSIGTGFEIVTHPMSYTYAMENFPWDMLPALARQGVEATDDCGLHVHVSREAFDSPCHAYRWMKLIYRNARHVQRIARRVSGQWAAFSDATRRAQKDHCKGERSAHRYSAINVQNHETFEVRVFASSLEPQEVKAALALVAASVEYTRTLTAHDVLRGNGWTWEAFMSWLPAEYESLRMEAATCAY